MIRDMINNLQMDLPVEQEVVENEMPRETPEVVEQVGPHPLNIHLIAESIFSHLDSILDLMSCRQVAWQWRQMLTPLVNSRNQAIRRISFSGSETEVENQNDAGDAASSLVPKLPEYMNYLKEEADMEPKLLFSHFLLYNLSLEQPLVQQFMDEFGHTIRKLDFSANDHADFRRFRYDMKYKDHSRHGGSMESFWRMLTTQCTELEDFKLEQVNLQTTSEDAFPPFHSKIKRLMFRYYYHEEKLQRLQPFISNLFRNCHWLERLILSHNICPEVFAFSLSESPHLSALKELTLEGVGVLEKWCANLARSENILRNLRLKKLKIDQMMLDETRGLSWFLQTQKTSLETLIIGNWDYFSIGSIGFGQEAVQPPRRLPFTGVMEKLKEFQIRTDFEELPFAFQPIDFQMQFPCLKKLMLEGFANKHPMDSWFPVGSEPQLTLEGLELPCAISQEHLARIGGIFPNVKKLRIEIVGELAVQQLFSQWPQLEFLCLQNLEGDDSILTGLSQKQLEAAEKIRMKMGREIHRIISLINPSKVAPSISNFKDLKELILHSNQPLTDLSLHYAISKLKNLEFLSVNKGQKFSEDGFSSIPHLQLCKDENKGWGQIGNRQYQKDLSKLYKPKRLIDSEFGSYYYPY